jgi:L-2-hydroxyglutarate oxidase LhgO
VDSVDCIVVGAGVVGLAVARALARDGHEVVLLESESQVGMHTSSRNSEVIHAGMYYPPGSLKAELCVAGNRMLYAFCDAHGVAHRKCGKLIVAAAPQDLDEIAAIARRGAANGVGDLRMIDAAAIRALEPDLSTVGGLLSPSTGIVDSHAFMLALRGDAEDAGATIAFRTWFEAAQPVRDGGFIVRIGGFALVARKLVNAAGLWASDVAARIEGLGEQPVPRTYFARGNYFSLAGPSPFRHLVYPVPEPGGLGVHLTLDLAGQARFGPDVEWIPAIDYSVDPRRAERFYAAIRRYWPGLRDGVLMPAYAGVRPKLSGPDEPAADFVLSGPAQHGLAGLVNLFGIESPGLTAALPLADRVAAMLA